MLEMTVGGDRFRVHAVFEVSISDPPFDFLGAWVERIVVQKEAILPNSYFVAFIVVGYRAASIELISRRHTDTFVVAGTPCDQESQNSDDYPKRHNGMVEAGRLCVNGHRRLDPNLPAA